jgi:purine-binding chemotaxis protein CheW
MDLTTQAALSADEEQLVIFTLGDESYGVSINAVNTIIRIPEITAVPHTRSYVKGVINLRGIIVPVIDLRERFGLSVTSGTKATRVVVVENEGMLVGMVVDAVTETLRLPAGNIEPLSALVVSADAHYLRGVGKHGDRLIILLALDKVLSREDAMDACATVADSASALSAL